MHLILITLNIIKKLRWMDHLSYIILFLGQSCILEALALDLSDTQEMNELKRQAFIYSFFKNISCILIRK